MDNTTEIHTDGIDSTYEKLDIDISKYSNLEVYLLHEHISVGYSHSGHTLKLTVYDRAAEIKSADNQTNYDNIKEEPLDVHQHADGDGGNIRPDLDAFVGIEASQEYGTQIPQVVGCKSVRESDHNEQGAGDVDLMVKKEITFADVKSSAENIPESSSNEDGHIETDDTPSCSANENEVRFESEEPQNEQELASRKLKACRNASISNNEEKSLASKPAGKSQCNLKGGKKKRVWPLKHKCSICGKCFRQTADLKRHHVIHTGEKPYVCHVCGGRFGQRTSLKSHLTVHTGEKPHKCDHCGKLFRMKNTLRTHILIHTGEKPHQCEECGKRFVQVGKLTIHRKTHEKDTANAPLEKEMQFVTLDGTFLTLGGEGNETAAISASDVVSTTNPLQCNVCGKVYASKQSLKCHIRIQTGEHLYHCKVCEKQCKTSSELNKHLVDTHPEEKWYKCWCGEKCQQFKTLTEHKEQAGHQKRLYECIDCNRSFKHDSAYYLHIKRVHKGEKNHECDICGKCFLTKADLRQHNVSHSDQRPFACHICPKMFKNQRHLTSHLKSHTEAKEHPCEYCGKLFKYRSSLHNHKRIHTGGKNKEKTHMCTVCDKFFMANSDLKRHSLTHTGEKPHTCGICGKSFNQKYSLTVHMRMHMGEESHTCKYCGKGFRATTALRHHEMTHTGEKPHTCNFCGKGFIQKSKLKGHLKTHTKE